MNAPRFLEGVIVALLAALAGSALVFLLAGVVAAPLLLRLVVASIGLGYVLYLLARSGTRAGKVSAVVAWALFTGVTLALDPPLLLHVCIQVGLIWMLRAIGVHRSVLPALADLGLCAASIAAAVWAAERTGSVFLAIWCLLLVQAAFVAIPRRGRPRDDHPASSGTDARRFARAHRSAEAALRRLSTVR